MTHFYNSVEWLIGPADRLVTDAAHQHLDGIEVEDTVHTLARHGSVMASYTLNMYEPSNELKITVVCASGTLQGDFLRLRWSWITEPAGEWNHHPVEFPERDTMYITQANAFLDSLAGKVQPLCTLQEAIVTLHTNLASLSSAQEGCWQPVSSNRSL